MSRISALRSRALQLRQYTLVVYFAARDPRTPLLVRVLAVLVAAYALSPIDLIPDFIPVVGYLDDLVIVPLGLALVVKLTPPEVIVSAKGRAERASGQPVSYTAAAVIIGLWLLAGWFLIRCLRDGLDN